MLGSTSKASCVNPVLPSNLSKLAVSVAPHGVVDFQIGADTGYIIQFFQCLQQLEALPDGVCILWAYLREGMPCVGPFLNLPALLSESALQGFKDLEGTVNQGLVVVAELVAIGLEA